MWRDYILYVLAGLFYTCVYRGTLVSGRMGMYFLCSKNIGADQLRTYCKTAKGSFVRTRFYLTRVLFLSAPLIMQKV